MKDIRLLGKKIIVDKCEILLKYTPDESWQEFWVPKTGEWHYEDGALVGTEKGNLGGILLSKERFEDDVMLIFKGSTVLPATRDLNAVFCANWDEETDYLGESYVCGLNGWYENKCGIERNLGNGLYSTTSSFEYIPGSEITMCCGAIGGHSFMTVDGELVTELIDPEPIKGGHVGFSAYCTRLKITDIEIRKVYWEEFIQEYTPEF